MAIASILSVTTALQLGSFSVVLETFLSGKTELPFKTFLLFMQPIHLVIGLVEGFITAAAVLFLREARPDLIPDESETGKKTWSYKKVIIVVTVAALIIGGIASWFSSNNPDGLEWSIEKVIGSAELRSGGNENKPLEELQKKITVLPDYQFKTDGESKSPQARKAGTSVSGLAGSAMTLALVAVIAFCTAFFKKKKGSA
jgi:cobalt/nickel transport system permease protein